MGTAAAQGKMMGDFILMDGDEAEFQSMFGLAMVQVQKGKLSASGPATLTDKKLCLAGDESRVMVAGCSYKTAIHSVDGIGTLKITALGPDQTATKTNSGGTPVLLKGSQFIAAFEVKKPAEQPSAAGPVPDGTPMYVGQGSFITQNSKFQGT
jgi:hypothetical protein